MVAVDAAAEEVVDGDSIEVVEEDVAGDTVVGTVVVVGTEADAAAGAGVVVGTIPTTKEKQTETKANVVNNTSISKR